MKRKLYFFLEQLQIKKSERIAVSVLFSGILIFSLLIQLQANRSAESHDYSKAEEIFRERAQQKEQEMQQIMKRYTPNTKKLSHTPVHSVSSDTLQADTTKNKSTDIPARININRAGYDELQKLPGVGPAYARRIVKWREDNGPFTSIDQLLEIRGIGDKRLENIRNLIEL